MDIKKLDNIEQGLLTLQNIKSTDNAADTKTTYSTHMSIQSWAEDYQDIYYKANQTKNHAQK
jgi:hypothetical protein